MLLAAGTLDNHRIASRHLKDVMNMICGRTNA